MSDTYQYDLVVIGGGPAGTRAALESAAAGMKTALAEPGFLGGTCLNAGCIPTKFLLGATCSLPLCSVQKKFTVASGDLQMDFSVLQERKNRYIKGARQSLQKRLETAGVTIIAGKAAFTGAHCASIKGQGIDVEVTFRTCVIATGSIPASFPALHPDGATVHASASILNLKEVPKSLLIIGGGAIGLELGELFHRLGCQILMVEGSPRILPGEDPETSEAVTKYLLKEGWELYTGEKIASLATENDQSVLRFENGQALRAAHSLLAIGRRPATTGLHPEAAELTMKPNGWIHTDEFLRCAAHIYAIGDINARTLLAHAAEHQARYAVRHILGRATTPYTPPAMPACIYGTMEVMRVGPTVGELQRRGHTVGVSCVPMAASAIAQGSGHTQGFVKMAWVDDILHSITAVGHHASHLVTLSALLVRDAIKKNIPPDVIFAHPTLDELIESTIMAPLVYVEPFSA